MALSNRFSGLERRDVRFTDKQFHIYFTETCVRKLLLKFYGDQKVGSKVLDLSNRYSGLERRDLRFTELRCVSTFTPRKPASGNSCKNLNAIKRSDQTFGLFEPVLWSGATRRPLHRQAIPHLLHGNLRPETPVKI